MHYHVRAWVVRWDAAGKYWQPMGETITRYLAGAQGYAQSLNANPESFRAEVSKACSCESGECELSGCLCAKVRR